MVRIVILPDKECGIQQVQFDLPFHNGHCYKNGDQITDVIFGAYILMVLNRKHYPSQDLLVIECIAQSNLLVGFKQYPRITGMPQVIQLPPQNWRPPSTF